MILLQEAKILLINKQQKHKFAGRYISICCLLSVIL